MRVEGAFLGGLVGGEYIEAWRSVDGTVDFELGLNAKTLRICYVSKNHVG